MRLELLSGLKRLWDPVDRQRATRPSLAGWDGAQWGELLDRVRARFPDAQTTGDGLGLTHQSTSPHQLTWSLDLGFDGEQQFQSVSLSFGGSRETADFAALSKVLLARLGTPDTDDGQTLTWRREAGTVSLSREAGGGVVFDQTA